MDMGLVDLFSMRLVVLVAVDELEEDVLNSELAECSSKERDNGLSGECVKGVSMDHGFVMAAAAATPAERVEEVDGRGLVLVVFC